jgi:hypothetical protein
VPLSPMRRSEGSKSLVGLVSGRQSVTDRTMTDVSSRKRTASGSVSATGVMMRTTDK